MSDKIKIFIACLLSLMYSPEELPYKVESFLSQDILPEIIKALEMPQVALNVPQVVSEIIKNFALRDFTKLCTLSSKFDRTIKPTLLSEAHKLALLADGRGEMHASALIEHARGAANLEHPLILVYDLCSDGMDAIKATLSLPYLTRILQELKFSDDYCYGGDLISQNLDRIFEGLSLSYIEERIQYCTARMAQVKAFLEVNPEAVWTTEEALFAPLRICIEHCEYAKIINFLLSLIKRELNAHRPPFFRGLIHKALHRLNLAPSGYSFFI